MPDRLRILHLAYEDWAQPRSGGGSVRTHEINRRLAREHDITVVAAGWPGAADRVEDGVRYTHAGTGRTRLRALAYLARTPMLARRAVADLVVEDFGAPISTLGLPRFTGVPVVAMVQWLFGREMGRKYGLPFHAVESWGLRAHQTCIAVSAGLAGHLRERHPSARISVVPNGVDATAFAVQAGPRRFADPAAPIVYLGRLDTAQKGLDVLLRALADVPGRRLLIAGDGPGAAPLARLAGRLGLTERVHWLGRVEGGAKYRLLADAAVVAVPSRFETFGMVAVEALACGTPVVATDIPCLRDVVPDEAGLRVPPGDPPALAAALRLVLDHPELAARFAAGARPFARQFGWDELAGRQDEIYRAAARSGSERYEGARS
ncbi:glycosyltransferase family 4 protein [Dactylosporangium sp. CS-047395]|uniref:glycosyltransferase family 4 protein n=1 Tax=Dactylosporangium sp. CS-047395 TaxID=3239936 RepID=UPI003D8ABD19